MRAPLAEFRRHVFTGAEEFAALFRDVLRVFDPPLQPLGVVAGAHAAENPAVTIAVCLHPDAHLFSRLDDFIGRQDVAKRRSRTSDY